jgi:hypothetical protein
MHELSNVDKCEDDRLFWLAGSSGRTTTLRSFTSRSTFFFWNPAFIMHNMYVYVSTKTLAEIPVCSRWLA